MPGRKRQPGDDPPPSSRARASDMLQGYEQGRGRLQREESLLDIVQRLIEHEAGTRRSPEELAQKSDEVCRKLRSHLVGVLGTSGFRFLMIRAVTIAGTNSTLVVDDEGYLKGLGGPGLGTSALGSSILNPSHQAAVVATLARFLELLAEIIGQNLVLRLIHQAWPEFSLLPRFSL